MTKKKLLFILLALLAAFSPILAQEVSVSKKINSIKRDSKYLYAEATMSSADDAYNTALELLHTQINEYVASKKKLSSAEDIIIKDIGSKSEQLQMQRGSMTRVFVYVQKQDIIPAENTTVVKKENKTVAEEGDVNVAPAQIEEISDGDTSLKLSVVWQQAVIDELLECGTLAEAKALLNRQRAEFKVKQSGSPDTCSDKTNCFWVIGDEAGNLVTVLGTGYSQRTNFKTLTLDTLDNYSGGTAIWFKMAK